MHCAESPFETQPIVHMGDPVGQPLGQLCHNTRIGTASLRTGEKHMCQLCGGFPLAGIQRDQIREVVERLYEWGYTAVNPRVYPDRDGFMVAHCFMLPPSSFHVPPTKCMSA